MKCKCKPATREGNTRLTTPGGKEIYVDACIADVIVKLWEHNVVTLGSCCGHNKDKPNVVINSPRPQQVIDILKEIDDRQWTVSQWMLVDYTYEPSIDEISVSFIPTRKDIKF